MKIGILSDTHGDHVRTGKAMRQLLQRGVAAICHCGDIGAERVLTEMASACQPTATPVHAVLGNVDLFEGDISGFPLGAGVQVWGRVAKLELAGKSIAIIHGDDDRLLRETLSRQTFDYVLTGHTHQPADERTGRTRLINPGAVYRARPPTVAVLDLSTDELELITLAPF